MSSEITSKNFELSFPHRVAFLPLRDEFGAPYDTMQFKASDGDKASSVVTVAFDVISVNDAPSANNDVIKLKEDSSILVAPTAYDETPSVSLTILIEAIPPDADLFQANPDGSQGAAITENSTVLTNPSNLFIYVPNADLCGVLTSVQFSTQDYEYPDQTIGLIKVILDVIVHFENS